MKCFFGLPVILTLTFGELSSMVVSEQDGMLKGKADRIEEFIHAAIFDDILCYFSLQLEMRGLGPRRERTNERE